MGAWGEKIFDSDDACDIRDDYREAIILGKSDEEAEEKIVCEYQEGIEGQSETFWLPLAITEWKAGRLSQRVKEHALAAIEEELSNLTEIWVPKAIKLREKELLKAKNQLLSPQPERKKLRMPSYAWKCPWPIGGVIQHKICWPGEHVELLHCYVLLLIVGITKQPEDRIPLDTVTVRLYNWFSVNPPTKDSVSALDLKTIPFYSYGDRPKEMLTFIGKCPAENEVKLVSKIPLGNQPLNSSQIDNTYYPANYDYSICNGIVHFFQSEKSIIG